MVTTISVVWMLGFLYLCIDRSGVFCLQLCVWPSVCPKLPENLKFHDTCILKIVCHSVVMLLETIKF